MTMQDEWNGLSDTEIESIKAGIADVEAGRTYSHDYVMAEMNKLIADFREKPFGYLPTPTPSK